MLGSVTIPDRATVGDTRMLDAAKGVLVALRRCTMADAFSEIVGTAGRYQIGVLAVSRALVDLAEDPTAAHAEDAAEAARRAWANLLVPG